MITFSITRFGIESTRFTVSANIARDDMEQMLSDNDVFLSGRQLDKLMTTGVAVQHSFCPRKRQTIAVASVRNITARIEQDKKSEEMLASKKARIVARKSNAASTIDRVVNKMVEGTISKTVGQSICRKALALY